MTNTRKQFLDHLQRATLAAHEAMGSVDERSDIECHRASEDLNVLANMLRQEASRLLLSPEERAAADTELREQIREAMSPLSIVREDDEG